MPTSSRERVVLEVAGVHWASEKAVAETVLGRRPGVLSVEANPVAQTATVTYDPATDVGGTSCAAGSATAATTAPGSRCPHHVCDPGRAGAPQGARRATGPRREHAGTSRRTRWATAGTTAGMSMDDMARDMRNRFLVAARAVGADPAVVADRPGGARLHRAGAVRAARRRLLAGPVAAGRLLLGLDLLRRRLAGAARADPGHDGAGRGRGRRRLALQPGRHADRRR